MPPSDPLIVFLHNGRTGGTTLREIIRCEYPPAEVRTVAGKERSLGGLKTALAGVDFSRLSAVQGHIPFGLHSFAGRPCGYITLLRDPIERMISLFYGEIGKGGERPSTRAALQQFRAFLNTGFIGSGNKRLEVDNAQTRRLSGRNPPFGRCSRSTLEIAKANLEEHVEVAGLTERFEESLVLMKRRLGWRSALFDRVNVTPWRPERSELPDSIVELIRQTNRYDVELYEAASALFEQAIAAEGPGFSDELGEWERMNALLVRALAFPNPGRGRVTPVAATDGLGPVQQVMLEAHVHSILRDRELERRAIVIARLEHTNARTRSRLEAAEARKRARKARQAGTRARKARAKPRAKKSPHEVRAKREKAKQAEAKPRAKKSPEQVRAKSEKAKQREPKQRVKKSPRQVRAKRADKAEIKNAKPRPGKDAAAVRAKREKKARAKSEAAAAPREGAERISQ